MFLKEFHNLKINRTLYENHIIGSLRYNEGFMMTLSPHITKEKHKRAEIFFNLSLLTSRC